MKYLFLLILFPIGLCAQFRGGTGDGFHESFTTSSVSLPLTIVSFTARFSTEGDRVIIDWQTDDEIDTDRFSVERSVDGSAFFSIADLPAAGNARGQRLSYRHADAGPLPGTSYYRLRTTDYDGSLTFSKVAAVTLAENAPEFTLYPNPTGGVQPQIRFAKTGAQSISVYDSEGREVFRSRNGDTPLPRLTKGSYWVIATSAAGLQRSSLLIVSEAL